MTATTTTPLIKTVKVEVLRFRDFESSLRTFFRNARAGKKFDPYTLHCNRIAYELAFDAVLKMRKSEAYRLHFDLTIQEVLDNDDEDSLTLKSYSKKGRLIGKMKIIKA